MAGHGEERLRIGELGRRVGLSPELLRAWERRYGVLRPARTEGGLRLYTADDERRVRRMLARIADGVSPAEAARVVLASDDLAAPDGAAAPLDHYAARLRDALDRFDAADANATLDRLLGSFVLETVLAEVLIPYLRDLGNRWESGEATIAQEHFASNVVRARLAGLSRGWEAGAGPLVLLACAPGEQHDLPLLAFGLALRARGWRIAYLGADTPSETVLDATRRLEPALVVVAAVARARFRAGAAELAAVANEVPLALAGQGASESLAESLGATWLSEGPVAAADRVSRERAG